MCRYFWNRRGDPHQTPLNALFFFVFKLRHDEGVKERSFYLCKIQSFYYKKYVQCREIKKSTDFLRNLPKSSELIYRNVTRWVWQHCLQSSFRSRSSVRFKSSSSTDSDSASDLADNPLSPFFLARSLPLRGNPGFPAFYISSWPVPSHCEGTPAFPLSPFSSWPVPSHCEGTPVFPLSPFLPGPFPPIAREPRLSRFLHLFLARSLPLRGNPGFPAFSLFFLARSLPLRGNPGLPAFSFLPGPLLPAVREPRPSRFLSPFFLRPEQEEPAAFRSDRKDNKYEPRSPPPARNTPPGHGHRPRKVPAPPGTNTPFICTLCK
jgi:hypothetical protein